jgi:hypothetical protein
MSEKAFKNSLNDVVTTLVKHESIIKDSQSDIKTCNELLNNICERVADISVKLDFFINMGGHSKKPKPLPVKTPEAATTTATKKPTKKPASVTAEPEAKSSKIIKNIMTYFKTRYTEDQTYFNDIFEENQIEALFVENEKDLSAKKGLNKTKAQANILYKNLSESQRKKVRERMSDENEAASIDNDDDIEEEHSN